MNRTIIRLSAQAVLGRRRGIVLVLVPVALLLLAVVVRLLTDGDVGFQATAGLGLTLALPLVALLASSAVLGPEVDDGSIVYLLAKPVSRHVVVVSKYATAWATTMVLGALPLALAALVLDPSLGRRALALGLGGAVAGTAYSALFLALAALTRHAVVVGLLYTLFWEGVLGSLLAGVRWLSVGAWGRAVAGEVSPLLADEASTGLVYSLVAAALVTLVTVWFAGDRLRSFTLRGDE
ncbi:ABC transporter permease [Phycicoccus endophyticus]|uniref:ABC transporter permease n=1 Tax=Phycicoccus endophyticus TaxID=1690220 RepID=A0A7G9R216_9MICO|nr:ABC transporter permease [Phycicoccus endophyticus]NHI19720.1 ABC transporter permease subunit [Phycicoccus endophyticus]QNN49641.1 ABC transporter permease [Phycicoccus endophyticus]GGL33577.1 ABC transporter permease [Phycicoccus endophyticus]